MSGTLGFTALLFQRRDCVVSYCPELQVGSFGDDVEEAAASLREAVECFLEGCRELGTLEDVLDEAGYHLTDDPTPRWEKPVLLKAEALEAAVA